MTYADRSPMSDAIGPEIARTYLRAIDPPWRRFWFHMHSTAKDLGEFAAGIDGMTDETFAYHVSGQKNDLARWVREVVGDSVLADELEKVKTKQEAAAVARERVAELRSALGEG